MRKVLVIGIGPGNPDYLTMQAVDALNRADVLLIPDKGAEKAELRELRAEICRRFVRAPGCRLVEFEALRRRTDLPYRETVAEWHGRIAVQYAALLERELDGTQAAGFLVWGDPGLYDSTLRILDAVRARGELALEVEVIPGITSVQALTARHRIPLNRIGEPVRITTGRRLEQHAAHELDGTVVMLDGEQAFARLDGEALDIFWGAYLGTPDEILVSGQLSAVREEITRRRAAARAAKGWIMDTYLLRRRTQT